eukprot:4673509-Karenia_brevis.AAC.1
MSNPQSEAVAAKRISIDPALVDDDAGGIKRQITPGEQSGAKRSLPNLPQGVKRDTTEFETEG